MQYEEGTTEFAILTGITYFILRFVLSFPLGLGAWFSEEMMGLVFFLSIPNAIIWVNFNRILNFIKSSFQWTLAKGNLFDLFGHE